MLTGCQGGPAGFLAHKPKQQGPIRTALKDLAELAPTSRFKPTNDRDWAPELAVLARAKIVGDKVTITNVRNCEWLTDVDCIVRHYDKTYDLRDLETVDYVVVPFNENRAIAHTMLSFGFGKGDYVGVSAEVRRERDELFSTAAGLLNQFELIYVVADEHDLLPVRVNQRASDVFLYRSTATPDEARAIFVDVMKRVNKLAEEPEFYNTLTNNCTTNIANHINAVAPGKVPYDYRVLLPGYSDQLAYDLGLIDTRLPFAELKARSRINSRVGEALASADFSAHVRR